MNKIYTTLFLLACSNLPASTNAQGLNITAGTSFVANGSPSIVLNNGGLVSNGIIAAGNSNFIFRGNANNININTAPVAGFYDLTLNKSSNDLTLASGIVVNNNLNMTNGNLELNGYNIILNGQIVGEDATSYITGIAGGAVQKTVVLNAPVAQNPGNMGFQITSTANLGSTVISRSHVQQTSATGYGINRFYDVTPTTNSNLGATVVFNYLDNELAGINEAELNLWKSPNAGGTWDLVGVNSLNTTTNALAKNSINSFSRLTLGSILSNPLPVGLISFTGILVNRKTQLQWTMSNEEGIDHYELQRSEDGNEFRQLELRNAKKAGGQVSYNTVDAAPFNGYTYYRLKIVDAAGKVNYSNTVRVQLADEGTVSVYPNPATDKVYIEFTSKENKHTTIKLTDALGRIVDSKTIYCTAGMNKIEWGLEQYASAVYYLLLDSQNNAAIKITKL